MGIFVLFLILEEKLQLLTIGYDVSGGSVLCGLIPDKVHSLHNRWMPNCENSLETA